MRDLPVGTVTFMFADVEASTRLLQALGNDRYAEALADHRRVMRTAFSAHGGVEIDAQGDAFFVAFAHASGAVAAAADAQRALGDGPIRVRMGLHTGNPKATTDGYVGADVHLGARLAAVGHGGQVLLSASTRKELDAATELTDLGEHRVKDFDDPVWIYQLGTASFPPLRSISNTNLPHPASAFIGREKELREITELLRRGRLVTLTGPGGCGKTRLSQEVAANLVPDFRNGTFWVELASISNPGLVLATISGTIGAKDDLASHIGERQMLIVLDNLEQVVTVAPELGRLVESCPNVRVLATSRERLRLRDELEYAVPPLARPDAIALFTTRTGMVGDDTVADLCERLDRLPLAIELAAARTSVMSPAQILDRLAGRLDLLKGGRDAEARQQTLRATIEWSHELLDADERLLFARLAVFGGGWTLEAAEAVAGADIDTLQSLVDKSLVRHDGERFTMLETIRHYALEQLERSGEADSVRRRHAAFFRELALGLEGVVLGIAPRAALDRLEVDNDNIRAALQCLEESEGPQAALEMAGALWEFWCLRAHAPEGWLRLNHLVELDQTPTIARAKALSGAAHLVTQVPGQATGEMARIGRQALALHRKFGDAWWTAFAEYEYAAGLAQNGEYAAALPLAEASIRRLRALGDEHRSLQALRLTAWCTMEVEGLDRARPIYEDLMSAARAAGDMQILPRALNALARFESRDGDHLAALQLLEEAFRIDSEYGDPAELVNDLVHFAASLARAERPRDAATVLAAALARQRELGLELPNWVVRIADDAENQARTQIDEVAWTAAGEHGARLSVEDAVTLAKAALDPTTSA